MLKNLLRVLGHALHIIFLSFDLILIGAINETSTERNQLIKILNLLLKEFLFFFKTSIKRFQHVFVKEEENSVVVSLLLIVSLHSAH